LFSAVPLPAGRYSLAGYRGCAPGYCSGGPLGRQLRIPNSELRTPDSELRTPNYFGVGMLVGATSDQAGLDQQVIHAAFLLDAAGELARLVADAQVQVASPGGADGAAPVLVEGEAAVGAWAISPAGPGAASARRSSPDRRGRCPCPSRCSARRHRLVQAALGGPCCSLKKTNAGCGHVRRHVLRMGLKVVDHRLELRLPPSPCRR